MADTCQPDQLRRANAFASLSDEQEQYHHVDRRVIAEELEGLDCEPEAGEEEAGGRLGTGWFHTWSCWITEPWDLRWVNGYCWQEAGHGGNALLHFRSCRLTFFLQNMSGQQGGWLPFHFLSATPNGTYKARGMPS